MTGPINEVNDLFVQTDAVQLPALSAAKSTWSMDRRYFDLTFGNVLATTLVGYDALLSPGQYLLGVDEIGKAILAKTTLNGKPVKKGFITVGARDGKYQINAEIDGQVLTWTGTLPFVADPAPLSLTDVLQANPNKDNKLITLNLATTGLHQEMDPQTYQNVWVGDGNYLALDIYSADGYLHEGNYFPCAEGGVLNDGEFGIGYDTTVEYWGQVYEVKDWGTCLWTVANGAATAEKITTGMVNVSSAEVGEEVIWTITWGVDYPVEVLFEGAIPAVTKPKGSAEFAYSYEFGEPTACVLNDNTTVVEGVKKNPVTIKDADGNIAVYLEFVLVDGSKELEGSFVSTEYAHEAGQLANGWFFDFGGGFSMGGGSYYFNESGEKVYIAPGQVVNVTKLVTGAYEFVGEGFDVKACGEGYVPGSYKDPNGTIYAMTDTVASDCTLEDGQTPVTDVESHTLVLKDGDTFVAQIKLIRSVGTSDLAGTYTVKEYAHEDFAAGNGFDLGAMFGMAPGSWVIGSYYIKGEEIVIIQPNETITVTATAPNTYKFEGSTGYTFIGKL